MRRGKSRQYSQEGGGWEIALADLMTVLMVFFLILWLVSIVDPGQRDELAASILGDEVIPMEVDESLIEMKQVLDLPAVTVEEIQESMSDVEMQDITIEETADFMRITLRSDSFFESGRASINRDIRQKLENLGSTLAGRGQDILITGHTDNVPISTLQFPSNWELSAARAATVARTFNAMGVNKDLITIMGRSDNDPVAQNTTVHGRSLNRRVIILVNKNPGSFIDNI